MSLAGVSVAVIGGGPGGLIAAAHFAKRGAHVTLYEGRTYEQQMIPPLGWTIALGNVARSAIERADISFDFGEWSRVEGTSIQHGLAKPKYYGEWTVSGLEFIELRAFVSRNLIMKHFREQIQQKYGSLVKLMDGHRLVGGNVCEGEVIFRRTVDTSYQGSARDEGKFKPDDESGQRVTARYDIVIGADGVHSRTRALIQKQDPSLTFTREFSDISSIAFLLPPLDPYTIAALPTGSGKPLHVIPRNHTAPLSGTFMWFGRPDFSAPETALGAKFFSMTSLENGQRMKASFSGSAKWWSVERSEDEIFRILQKVFPQIPIVWLQACAKVSADPHNNGLRTSGFVHCSKLGSGRAVLIGDAAHAVAPNIGAGATSAMDDGFRLATCASILVAGGDNVDNHPEPTKATTTVASGDKNGTAAAASAAGGIGAGVTAENAGDGPSGGTDHGGSDQEVSVATSEKAVAAKQILKGVAEAWTKERIRDANALSTISKRMNDMMFRKFHGSWYKTLRAMPVAVPANLAWMPSFPFKGFIAAPYMNTMMINGGMRPAEIEDALYASFYRVMMVGGVCAAALAGLTFKAVSLARQHAG